MHACGNEHPGKAEWRATLLASRSAVPPDLRAAEAAALAEAAAGLVFGAIVGAYLPFGTEPGSTALLDALRDSGAQVLLPIVPPTPGALDWAAYDGPATLVEGKFRGLLEPSGRRLGTAAIGAASLVLVPALAVDRSGVRLGRGAGYYDRSLGFAAPDSALVAVVRDAELVDRLPAEPHDLRMTGALTPGGGLTKLPSS
ncbi:5-formyltetrahydrofolate cyclo-ligase [Amycolatopsis nigrescens]|uniref:5-formyltetrahydrofolate cyclo-ligase n=1 Tax=Amycolatopsis nigrescens TaxID=381445 RepID=UPI00036A4CBF|nr:5-formyltetrahydrofolate cyclo-ligase [Amycolatopsis nigrescens]